MASQKLTNCSVAAIALVAAAYLGAPHSSTTARLAFGAFWLAIYSFCFLAKTSLLRMVSPIVLTLARQKKCLAEDAKGRPRED
jgi:uncharacterized membrane protein